MEKIIMTADEIKKYREEKIKNLKYTKPYKDFLKYIERKLLISIDNDPCVTTVPIAIPPDRHARLDHNIPDNINLCVIHDILVDDYGYNVKFTYEGKTEFICIILE